MHSPLLPARISPEEALLLFKLLLFKLLFKLLLLLLLSSYCLFPFPQHLRACV